MAFVVMTVKHGINAQSAEKHLVAGASTIKRKTKMGQISIAHSAKSNWMGWIKKGEPMKELIDRNALIAEYDRVHIGPPGGARKLMEDAPTAVALEATTSCEDPNTEYITFPDGLRLIFREGEYAGWYVCGQEDRCEIAEIVENCEDCSFCDKN